MGTTLQSLPITIPMSYHFSSLFWIKFTCFMNEIRIRNLSLAYTLLYNYTTTSIVSILCFYFSCTITNESNLIIWGTKWIHLKMSPTINLHNFLRSTSSILIVSSSDAVYKIWISNLKTSHEFFYDKMISNQNIVNYKVSLHF
jgi:hypothetical protein